MLFWAGRKAAFPAVGQITPDYMCLDGSVPRGRLVEVLAEMRQMSKQHRLRVVNVFHAGDGNLHPIILFDIHKPGAFAATMRGEGTFTIIKDEA